MVQIPTSYPPVQEAAIASYSYTDIAEGTGVVLFYGSNAITSGPTPSWHLGTAVIASHNISTGTADVNYDLTAFNLPKTVKGTATLRFSSYFNAAGGNTYSVACTIYHVDADSNETSIGTKTTIEETSAGAVILTNHVLPISLTEKHFKKGETLRLNLIITKSAGTVNIGSDPANRDGTLITPAATYPTKLELYIPFRIDI